MEMLTLLLTLFAASGYSYVLQPKLTHTEITVLDGDHQSKLRSKQLGHAFISVGEKGNEKKNMASEKTEEEQKSEALIPEMNPLKESVKDDMTVWDRKTEDGRTQEASKEIMRMDTVTAGLAETKSIGKILDRDQGNEKVSEERLTPETESTTKRVEYFVKSENEESRIVKEIPIDDANNSKMVETVNSHNSMTQHKERDDQTVDKFERGDHIDNLKQRTVQEEQDSMLVAGIHLEVKRGYTHEIRQENEERENEKRAKKGERIKNGRHELSEKEKKVNGLRSPLSTFSVHVREESEIPTTIQSQVLTSSPPHHHNVPPIPAITPTQASSHSASHYDNVGSQFSPSSVTPPTHTNTGYVSLAAGDVKSVSLVEDLVIEVLQSPGHNPKQNKLEVNAKPNLEDEIVRNIQVKPVRKGVQTTHKEEDTGDINTTFKPTESPFISKEQTATPKPIEARFVTTQFKPTQKLKEATASPEFKENNLPANLTHKADMTQPTGQNKTVKPMENNTKRTLKKNKASLPKPQLTKPLAKTQMTKANGKTQTKIHRSSTSKTIKKTEETKRKKDNKRHNPSEEPTHFPYFMDNYCPPECACYGRVVQCSDKGVEKVPYGIPYSARYILLMNNHINGIQLDVLNEYASMEFLVLSNNQLTDGAIEGAFVGVPALKRLYLDKNLLQSVPTDLPLSLEELRLDNNRLTVMTEAAWAHCPGLLVLSLSNNSLGNGSESLPTAVLSPLCHLRTLNLDHNQLISVPLGLPLSIKELYLKGNLIEQFRGGAFNGVSELVLLDLSANRLTNKGFLRESLLNATRLESLNLEGNKLKQVPRHLPLSLKTLNLEGNRISSIKKAAFSTLKNLEHLGLAKNKIFKVAPGAFKSMPALHQLDLCYNTLRQVPRQLPQSLHSVALTHNEIQSVPRDAFCWGNKTLSLSGLVRVQLENNLIDLGNFDTQAFRCLRGFQVVHFY